MTFYRSSCDPIAARRLILMASLFRLKCFGTGDGWPCADRHHSSYYYQLGEVRLLFDCGDSLSRSFKAGGYDVDGPDAIFISHFHGDHIGGFFMFVQGLWLEKRQKDLPILMPIDGIEPVQNLLQKGCLFSELMDFKLSFLELNPSRKPTFGPVQVTPFQNSHLDNLRARFQHLYPQQFESYSFLMETNDLRVVHSADLGAPEDLDPMLQDPLDLLVCELSHFTPESLFRYLQGRMIKRLVLMHVGRPYWEKLSETRQLAEEMLPSMEITFAQDGDEIAF